MSRSLRLLALLLLLCAPALAAQDADTLTLDGPWRFHRGDDLAWAAAGLDDQAWEQIPVPGEWETHIGAYDGFGWYRRELRLPESYASSPIGLRFGTVGDAFEVFWNGIKVGASGRLPPRFVEGVQPVLFLVPDSALARADNGRHVVAVRIFNDYAYGGLMMPVQVGRYDVLAAQRSPRTVVIGGLVSFFLAIGIYHFAFFLRRRASRENLYFAVLCLCISVYGATYAENVAQGVMPVINPYRLGLLALLAAGPCYVVLVNGLFGLRLGRWVRLVHLAFLAAFIVAAVLPLRLLAEFNRLIDAGLVVGLLATVVRAWIAASPSTPHARTLLLGTATFSITLVYDLLSEYGAVPIPRVLPGVPGLFWVGFLVFVLAVGIATAGKWALTEVTALVDPLTELSRRHVLEDALRREAGRLQRTGGSLALVMIDLDHFKRVNDTHGHPTGDEVLSRVGRLLRASARNLDLPARYGGEEFAVLLYDTDLPGALSFAERFRANLRQLKVSAPTGATVQVSASVGVAVGSDLVDPDALVDAADRALYRAKSEGRDRLVSVTVDGHDRVSEFVAQ